MMQWELGVELKKRDAVREEGLEGRTEWQEGDQGAGPDQARRKVALHLGKAAEQKQEPRSRAERVYGLLHQLLGAERGQEL